MKYIHSTLALVLVSKSIFAADTASVTSSKSFEWNHVAEVRVAFYEATSSRLSASFLAAVKESCRASSSTAAAPSWLCNGDAVHFVRAVDVLGNRSNTGFVCEGRSSLKYYTPDMFGEESGCLAICYDTKKKNHYVQVAPK